MATLWKKRLSAKVKTGSSVIQSALGKDRSGLVGLVYHCLTAYSGGVAHYCFYMPLWELQKSQREKYLYFPPLTHTQQGTIIFKTSEHNVKGFVFRNQTPFHEPRGAAQSQLRRGGFSWFVELHLWQHFGKGKRGRLHHHRALKNRFFFFKNTGLKHHRANTFLVLHPHLFVLHVYPSWYVRWLRVVHTQGFLCRYVNYEND